MKKLLLLVLGCLGLIQNVYSLQCYKCSSDKIAECATLELFGEAITVPYETCQLGVTACYASVRSDGITVRGCHQTVETIQNCIGEKCAVCSSDKCNGGIVLPTAPRADEEYCYFCDSEIDGNCRTNVNSTMEVLCPLSGENALGCYLYDDGAKVRRGCVSSLETTELELCYQEGNHCKTCVGRNCNEKIQFQSCLSCSSTSNLNCFLNIDRVPKEICHHYTDSCFVHIANNQLTRGCSKDYPQYEATCNSNSNKECQLCADSQNCNNNTVVGDDFCLTCDSETDPNCISHVNNTMYTQCPLSIEKFGCYTYIAGDIVKRGCVNNLHPAEISLCRQQNSDCKICTGSYCNEKLEFQKCYTCDSSLDVNCVRSPASVAQVTCSNYIDECYVHVEQDRVRRGCVKNTATPPAISTECNRGNSNLCEKCSNGTVCNSKSIEDEFCLTCDSEKDINCVQNLDFSMRTKCELSVRPKGCYRYDDGGDIVKRGCVSDLLQQEQNLCNSIFSNECKTCIGDNCNAKVSFQSCKVCNSTQNVDCIRATHYIDSKVCLSYDDDCYTHVKDDVIMRGCLSERPSYVNDCKNGDICETCKDRDDCNDNIVNGEFCYTCDSETDPNCRSNLNVTMRKQCSLSVTPMGCYLYDDGGEVVKRGCLSDIVADEVTMCRSNGAFCKTCAGNDCNKKIEFQKCRTCNSNTNVNCIRSPGSFASTTCRNYLDECFVHVDDNVVTRGCLLQNAPANIQTECNKTNSNLCQKCDDPGSCNSYLIDGEFCLTCNSETNLDCVDNLNYTLRKQCDLGVRPWGCYLYNDGGDIVKRGCVNDLLADEVSSCRQEGRLCKTCVGDDCNAKVNFQSCKVCNSTENVDCIRSTHYIDSKICQRYDDNCYTHVKDDVITRGCLVETPAYDADCKNGDICERCEDRDDCNDKVVNGEFCITCDSEVDPNCKSNFNVTMRTQCSLSVSPMGCYHYDDGGEVVKRGCLADIVTDEVNMCRSNGAFCKTCLGNDCNTRVEYQKCRSCNSATDVNCIRSPGSVAQVTCRNYTDQCFINVENNVVTRGCLDQSTTPIQNECGLANTEKCEICSQANNCNNRIIDGEFCVTCNSEIHQNCTTNVDLALHTQCKLNINRMGCYLYDDGGDIVKRGCLSDILPQEVALCRRETSECKTCIGDDCNAKETFQKCRRCTSVTDVNCIRSPGSVAQVTCPRYYDDCFVHVEDNIVQRGCIQNSAAPIRNECSRANSELCEKCTDANNCNNKIVDGEFCLTCNSEEDINCVTNLNYTMRTQCKLGVRQNGCYRYDDGGDIVKRGCVSDILPQEKTLCRQERNECKTCIGDDCNAKVDFQSCKVCNSTQNVDCIRSTHYVDSKVCRKYTDDCYTRVKDDVILRGCLADTPLYEDDCRNGDICEKCDDSEDCNNKVVNGEFCYTCDSENDPNCRHNLNVTMRTQCKLAVTRMGCYLFNDGGDTVKRGCLSEMHPGEVRMCRENDQYCKSCLGDDCNKKAEFQTCYACNSATDENCLTPNEHTAHKQCNSYLDDCFTRMTGNVVTRGCFLEQENDCATDGTCEKCTNGELCNNKVVEEEYCYTCDSETDANCRENLNATLSTSCHGGLTFVKNGCYRYDDGGDIVKRGCLSDILQPEVTMCRQNGQYCKTCIGNDCNQKVSFQTCHTCTSITDPNCVYVSEDISTKLCRNYTDTCLTYAVEHGHTERGCTSELATTITDLSEECDENNCNSLYFPKDRKKCYQCVAGYDCNNNLADDNLLACQIYEQDELCYAFIDDNNLMHRGCWSDQTAAKVYCDLTPEKCKTCEGGLSVGCNNYPNITSPELSCITCSQDNEACAWGHNPSDAQKCTSNVLFLSAESCFTYTYDNGQVSRGCTLDNVICNSDESKCTKCDRQVGCNIANVVRQSCNKCQTNSSEDSCAVGNTTSFSEICTPVGEVIEYSQRGCYTLNDDSVITRGCGTDLSPSSLGDCLNDEFESCEYCYGHECNVNPAPSGANTLMQGLSILTSITVLALVKILM